MGYALRGCRGRVCVVLLALWAGPAARAQDAGLDGIRNATTISPADQQRIRSWATARFDELTKSEDDARFKTFRQAFDDQRRNPANSLEFLRQLAAQTGEVAAARLPQTGLDRVAATALARVLVDMNQVEAVGGLTAGVASEHASVRYLCATGLARLGTQVAADKEMTGRVVSALRTAGVAEADPIVTKAIYRALALPNAMDAVLDAYLEIIDHRHELRREGDVGLDRAEWVAFEYLRGGAAAVNPENQAKLVRRAAVELRMDAERYAQEHLQFTEIDSLERTMDAAEGLLEAIVKQPGGIRQQLAVGGHQARAQVLVEAYKWVGNAAANEAGVLNAAPWNVPIGAP